MNSAGSEIEKVAKWNLNTSLINLIVLIPIIYIMNGVNLYERDSSNALTVLFVIIGAGITITFNVMMIKLHFP